MPCLPEQIFAKIVYPHVRNEWHWFGWSLLPLFSIASLAALIEAEGSISDNRSSGSGNRNIDKVTLKYYKTHSYCKDNVLTWVQTGIILLIVEYIFEEYLDLEYIFAEKGHFEISGKKPFKNNPLYGTYVTSWAKTSIVCTSNFGHLMNYKSVRKHAMTWNVER